MKLLKRIRYPLIILPISFIVLTLIGAFQDPHFASRLTTVFSHLMADAGWMVCLGILLNLGFLAFIYINPKIGNLKFGGPNAQPQYNYWNWFAISLCAGIGTGIVFWGAVEPLQIAFHPPVSTGFEAGSYNAIIYGMAKSFQHWAFQPYSIYAIPAIVVGYAFWNMGKSFHASNGFSYFKKGKAVNKKFATFVDIFVIFALVGGTAGSLGYGLLQIGSGLDTVFHIPAGIVSWVVICIVIVCAYTISSASGLDKGIKWLSDKNAWLLILFMVFVFICGPGRYICNLFTESLGYYLQNIVTLTTFTQPVTGAISKAELWPQWWDEYWMVDWLAFGPITGMFLIKMAYGRSIREFINCNVILPAFFAIIWFSTFGGFAINIQLTGKYDLVAYLAKFGSEALMLKLCDFLPLSDLIKVVLMVVVALSFVTLADSMTSTISEMTLKIHKSDEKEAPVPIKIFWGVMIGIIAVVFTVTGKIEGIKIVKTFAGFPMLFVEIAYVIGFLWYHCKGHAKNDTETYKEDLERQIREYKRLDPIRKPKEE